MVREGRIIGGVISYVEHFGGEELVRRFLEEANNKKILEDPEKLIILARKYTSDNAVNTLDK